jgi:hypothetical protein
MALQRYQVAYKLPGLNVFLSNVQSIQVSIGRQAQLDQVKTSTGNFVLRYPTGYASPIAALVPGTGILISNGITGLKIFEGFISDVTAEYGIPYVSNVGQADYLIVSFEGAFAAAGRMQGDNYAMPADDIVNQVTNCEIETGLQIAYNPLGNTLAATTVSSTWGDWLARVCQSTNARLRENNDQIVINNPFVTTVSSINFSDVANDATNQVYNQINFDSLADNFYTQVTVNTESFGSVTVTKSGATAPFRTYETNTLNASIGQATDFANFLLGTYSTPKLSISSFTCSAESQAVFKLDNVGLGINLIQGTQTNVTFRGTTYVCIIEGVTISATPAGASYTFYVSGADLNAYLRLNDATFGKLDFNRLGY